LFFKQCIKELSKKNIIIDIGGGHPFQKEMKKYEKYFDNNYFTIDINLRFKPSIVADAHNLPFKSQSIPAILCKALLEHVPEPHKVINEISRVLENDGKGLFYFPFLYPYHAREKYYNDYFRFTKDGIKFLFRSFSQVEMMSVRGPFETIINFFPQYISKILIFPSKILDKFKKHSNQVSGYFVYVKK